MQHLRAIRERLDLSQAALAEAVGVSQSNVSHYECGRQQMPPAVARKLIEFARGRGVEISFDDVYSLDTHYPAEPAA